MANQHQGKKQGYLQKWRSYFDNTMSAVTFAEANQPEEAKNFLNIKKDSVILVTNLEGPGSKSLKYSADLCRNTDSALIVFHIADKVRRDQEQSLVRRIRRKIDVPFIFINLKELTKEELKSLVHSTSNIISVVLDQKWAEETLLGKKYRKWLYKLDCPVVLIDEKMA